MKNNNSPLDPEDLRKRAEESLKSEPDKSNDTWLEATNTLIHELRVHQIELEIQNEELRRAQNDIEISRSRYADLYDFAPVGYFTLNQHGLIIDLNLTAARKLGIERGLLINRHFQNSVFQLDITEFLSHLKAVFDKRERQIADVRLSPKGGGQFYARLESIPMEGEDGAGLCRMSMSDITQQKKAEQILQNAHEERAIELMKAHGELDLGRAELAHVDRVSIMAEIASSMAHELSQPLTGSLTNAQAARRLLSMENPDLVEVRSALEDVIADNQRASSVVQNLRSFLRKQNPEQQSIDINTVVRDAVKLIASEALQKEIPIEIHLASGLSHIMGNSIQLQQVLLNLIMNGFDAITTHGPECRKISIQTSRDETGNMGMEVSDTGHGMDVETMSHIFESFFSTKPEGLGMGLAICRRIVERHKGHITARSTPGHGTTFMITLPDNQRRDEL
jgi:PAS domain S-box-containing protein